MPRNTRQLFASRPNGMGAKDDAEDASKAPPERGFTEVDPHSPDAEPLAYLSPTVEGEGASGHRGRTRAWHGKQA